MQLYSEILDFLKDNEKLGLGQFSTTDLLQTKILVDKYRFPSIYIIKESDEFDKKHWYGRIKFVDYAGLVDLQLPLRLKTSSSFNVLHVEAFVLQGKWNIKSFYVTDSQGSTLINRILWDAHDKDGIPFMNPGISIF